jgi:hypothetical protein
VEKASSLIEADESPDRGTGSGVMSSRVVSAGHVVSAGQFGSEAMPGQSSAPPGPRALKPVESGVFSAVATPMTGEQLVESLQGALSAASRGEAGLGSLHRSMRDASRALTASRNAYESLTEELRVLYRGLNEALSEKAATERYAALLTQERDAALDAAEETRREAKREREFLVREQDRFIRLLLEEHEAELAQLKRGLARQTTPLAPPAASIPSTASSTSTSSAAAPAQAIQPSPVRAVEAREKPIRVADDEEPTAPRISNSVVARVQLASGVHPVGVAFIETSPVASAGCSDPAGPRSETETQRSEAPPADEEGKNGDRPPTYPPAPAVLDLDSLAAEVDGNSERPPPIRRLQGAEAKLHLKPARVPTLIDTLVSQTGETEPPRKR